MSLATVETNKSVKDFISSIKNKTKREDSKKLVKMIQKITGKTPKIWGDNFIIGFGKYKYKRKGSKEEFEWFNVGFAPRKTNLTIYVTCDISKEPLIKKLGKCKFGRGCLYINNLEDVDLEVLKKIVTKNKDNSWF
jgi:hypothetical protein